MFLKLRSLCDTYLCRRKLLSKVNGEGVDQSINGQVLMLSQCAYFNRSPYFIRTAVLDSGLLKS